MFNKTKNSYKLEKKKYKNLKIKNKKQNYFFKKIKLKKG
jgi:hypothetical protein